MIPAVSKGSIPLISQHFWVRVSSDTFLALLLFAVLIVTESFVIYLLFIVRATSKQSKAMIETSCDQLSTALLRTSSPCKTSFISLPTRASSLKNELFTGLNWRSIFKNRRFSHTSSFVLNCFNFSLAWQLSEWIVQIKRDIIQQKFIFVRSILVQRTSPKDGSFSSYY